ncbi:MAG: hypothetical protein JNJ83_02435 [Verrucomicrobiaceae bacterium]|nr:hypothetical protein [Verrucomicrobiaceae bacterium]
MKTKSIILAAILTTVQTATAAKPTAPAVKLPQTSAMRSMRQPLFNTTKSQFPAQKAPAAFRSAPRVSAPSLPAKPPRNIVPSLSPTPRLNGNLNQPALRNGFDATKVIEGGNALRPMIPSSLGESFGMDFKTPREQNKPNLNVGNAETFTPRSPKNPLDRFASPRAGMTDIRERSRSTRQGTEFNLTSQTTNNADGTTTTVVKQHDSNGRVTDYTSTTTDSDSQVVSRQEQHAGDRSVEVHTSARNADGTYTHQTRGYAPDGSGHLGRTWTSDNPYSSTDRSPDGSSLGGPVNGTGPSVAQVAGLESLDLLRQKAEGQTTGGTNTMTSGRVRSTHVRPIGDTGTSFGGPNRNGIDISTNPEANVRGGSTLGGGNDMPN